MHRHCISGQVKTSKEGAASEQDVRETRFEKVQERGHWKDTVYDNRRSRSLYFGVRVGVLILLLLHPSIHVHSTKPLDITPALAYSRTYACAVSFLNWLGLK